MSKFLATVLLGEQQVKLDLVHFLSLDSVELHPVIGPLLHSSLATIAGCGATLPYIKSRPRVKLQKIVVGAVMSVQAFELRKAIVSRARANKGFPSLANATHLMAGMLRSQFGRNLASILTYRLLSVELMSL